MLGILIILVLYSILKKDKVSGTEADIQKFSGIIEGQLKTQPDLLSSKVSESVQNKFSEFKENISKNNQDQIKEFSKLKESLTENLSGNSEKLLGGLTKFKDGFKKDLTEDFDKLNETVESRLNKISNKVMENLEEGFKKTNKTFTNVIVSIGKIEKAQEDMNKLSTEIVDFKDILKDKKTRGIFGEGQLYHILENVFGKANKGKLYDTQYTLTNKKIVDSVLLMPEDIGNISVDSKFPLEGFRKLTDNTLSETEFKSATTNFKNDVKEHIKNISSKYIIPGETSDQALMFLPAESIYLEILVNHQDLVDFAHSKRVILTAPNNFLAFLTTVRNVHVDQERKKYAHIIQEELIILSKEFGRYSERWNKLKTHMDTVSKDVNLIHISTNKISGKFKKISDVKLENNSKNPVELLEEIKK